MRDGHSGLTQDANQIITSPSVVFIRSPTCLTQSFSQKGQAGIHWQACGHLSYSHSSFLQAFSSPYRSTTQARKKHLFSVLKSGSLAHRLMRLAVLRLIFAIRCLILVLFTTHTFLKFKQWAVAIEPHFCPSTTCTPLTVLTIHFSSFLILQRPHDQPNTQDTNISPATIMMSVKISSMFILLSLQFCHKIFETSLMLLNRFVRLFF